MLLIGSNYLRVWVNISGTFLLGLKAFMAKVSCNFIEGSPFNANILTASEQKLIEKLENGMRF